MHFFGEVQGLLMERQMVCVCVYVYVWMDAQWPLSQGVNAPVYAMYHFINKGLFLRK